MSFLRNIALILAFVLMLVGNTAALDICVVGGKLSLAGTHPCECANILHDDTHQECGKTHPPETPHEHMTVELDDDLSSGKTSTSIPVPTFVFLCTFFESFSEIRVLSTTEEAPPPPPDSRQILLQSPVATGTRPLLA